MKKIFIILVSLTLILTLTSCIEDAITKDRSTLILTTGIYTFNQDSNTDPKPLSLQNYNYRPRGRVNGVWKDIYVEKLEISEEYITIYFQNKATGGDGYGADYRSNGWENTSTNKPALYDPLTEDFITNTGYTSNGAGYIQSVVFPRDMETMRFELKKNIGLSDEMVFTQINLRKAVYKVN